MIIAQQRAKLANQKAKLAAQRYKDLKISKYKTPHKIKHQLKNVQISQSARKSTIGAAGANYDNTWFEDMAGVPKNFILYKGTPSERKGTIKEWNSMTEGQQETFVKKPFNQFAAFPDYVDPVKGRDSWKWQGQVHGR